MVWAEDGTRIVSISLECVLSIRAGVFLGQDWELGMDFGSRFRVRTHWGLYFLERLLGLVPWWVGWSTTMKRRLGLSWPPLFSLGHSNLGVPSSCFGRRGHEELSL